MHAAEPLIEDLEFRAPARLLEAAPAGPRLVVPTQAASVRAWWWSLPGGKNAAAAAAATVSSRRLLVRSTLGTAASHRSGGEEALFAPIAAVLPSTGQRRRMQQLDPVLLTGKGPVVVFFSVMGLIFICNHFNG